MVYVGHWRIKIATKALTSKSQLGGGLLFLASMGGKALVDPAVLGLHVADGEVAASARGRCSEPR